MQQHLSALILLSSLALGALSACGTARLEPAAANQKVPNKPNAARTEIAGGVQVQVEAGAWMADDRVKDEVTAMKVTLVNRSEKPTTIDYNAFLLVSDAGKSFRPIPAKEIPIRGATRTIGLPADTLVTRSSDSSVNAPNREQSEKDQIRERLEQQQLHSAELPVGERVVGYVFFERVPATVSLVTFKGTLRDTKSGKVSEEARLEFRPRQYR